MHVEPKKRDAVLNAIRALRLRRVRPSGQKIAWYLKRHNLFDEETTVETLDGLVRTSDILRVEYKGAISYRLAKSRSSKSSSKIPPLDGNSVRRAILSAVDNCGTSGGTRHRIAACLQTRGLGKLVGRLDVILQRELRGGILTKKVETKDGKNNTLYSIGNHSTDTTREPSSSSETDSVGDCEDEKTQAPFEHLQLQLKLLETQKTDKQIDKSETDAAINLFDNEQPYKTILGEFEKTDNIKSVKRGRPRKYPLEMKDVLPKKKGRPPSKRTKKEKKVYDPSNGCKKRSFLSHMTHRSTDKCYVCDTNEKDILSCNICSTKAHPKCVGYDIELASKILKYPWTCMDCKSCSICKYNHRIGTLIFCDKCDRAFHQTCHSPPLNDCPTGPWVCFICSPHEKDNVYQSLIPWLPTPVSSPERDEENSSGPSERAEITEVPNVSSWSIDAVVNYFQDNRFTDISNVFKEQEIDGEALMILSRDDVVNGLGLKLGPALRLYRQIRVLQTRMQNPTFSNSS